jgi:DNA-3-methyladenine glycosylase II
MNSNTKAINHLKKDIKLKRLIEATTLKSSAKSSSCYEALVKSIVSQQLSVKAAASIYGRLLSLTKKPITKPAILRLSHEALRSVGLSNSKANYIKNVAHFFTERKLTDKQLVSLPDEAIISLLTEIKGVGVWTVQMMLMFQLDRPDVFPVGDLEIRKQVIRLYTIKAEGKKLYPAIEAAVESWKPYRTIACKYLWAHSNQNT